jgi:hypothetical protein
MKRSPIRRTKPLRRTKADGLAIEREPHPIALKPIQRSVSYEGTTVLGAQKQDRAPGGKAEQEHKEALAALGCMVCRRLFPFLAPGPVQLHHLRAGGWGKGDWTTLIPLCEPHHTGDQGVHGLGTKGFVKRYGFTQADLLLDAMTLLKGTEA